MNPPWVAIEVSRRMRMVNGSLQGAGGLSAGGVNLLEHQVRIALQIAPPERIMLLTPQSDEALLDLAARHELREMPPLEFVSLMRERAAAGDDAPVILLRQIAPLRDADDLREAVTKLRDHPAVVSASTPPPGHARHVPPPDAEGPDYRCLAFEVRRLATFIGGLTTDEAEHMIAWDSFAEWLRPEDEPQVAARLQAWG